MNDFIEIGHVARAHGVRGELRAEGELIDALDALDRVFLGDARREHAIESARPAGDAWLLALDGVVDRDAAEALKGTRLYAARAELPELADDEVYVSDLVGCAVVDRAGAAIGTVAGVERPAGQEILRVARPGGGEALVPLVEPIVVSVDLAAKRIVCDPPEGLLDL
jgi:16S rRNA processing protein RimM